MKGVRINFDDSTVVIRDGTTLYKDTIANFELDAGQPMPATPPNIVVATYNQADGIIVVSNGEAQRSITSAVWKARFDWCIGAINSLLAAQLARVPAPNAPPDGSLLARITALEVAVSNLTNTVNVLEGRVTALENAP